MNITIDKLPECKVSARVEIPADAVAKERERIIRAFGSQARIPGYRPGKIPRKVVEKRFAGQIAEELNERLVRQGCGEVMQRDDLEVLGVGKVDDPQIEGDGSLTFSAEFITAPEFDLPDYKGIEVQLPKVVVEDAAIDRVIENMRERFADFQDVTDRPVAVGDFAVISYTASVDGQPLEEFIGEEVGSLASNEEYWLRIEAEEGDEKANRPGGGFLPGFAPQLVGVEKGATKDVLVKLPEDFGIEKLRDVEVTYTTEVKGIKDQQLPAVDDELAAKIKPGSDLAGLRETIGEQMRAEQENQRDEIHTQQVLDHIAAQVQFELPEHAVNDEAQRQINSMVQRGQQQGMSDDQIMEHQSEILGNAQERARSNVKNTFLLQEIAKREEITASEDELKQEIAVLAARSQRPVKKVLKELQESNGLGDLRHRIVIGKTLDFLREQSTVTEVEAEES